MTTNSHPGLNKAGRATAMVAAVVVSALTVVQSRINGQLGKELDDGILAAWISFVIGLVAIVVIVVASKRHRKAVGVLRDAVRKKPGRGRLIAPWELLGGLGGATFVAAQSTTVQYLGVAVFTVAVVAAQNANSLVVDRVGLGPAGVQTITSRRDHRNRRCGARGFQPRQRRRLQVRGVDLRADRGTPHSGATGAQRTSCGNLWLTVCCRVGQLRRWLRRTFLRGSHLPISVTTPNRSVPVAN